MCWGRWLQRWCCQGSGGDRCTISQPGYGSEIEDGIRRSQWISLVWGRSLQICFASSWQVVETSGWLWCLTVAGSEICWEQPPLSAFWLASTWAPKAVSQVWSDHLHDGILGQLSRFFLLCFRFWNLFLATYNLTYLFFLGDCNMVLVPPHTHWLFWSEAKHGHHPIQGALAEEMTSFFLRNEAAVDLGPKKMRAKVHLNTAHAIGITTVQYRTQSFWMVCGHGLGYRYATWGIYAINI